MFGIINQFCIKYVEIGFIKLPSLTSIAPLYTVYDNTVSFSLPSLFAYELIYNVSVARPIGMCYVVCNDYCYVAMIR